MLPFVGHLPQLGGHLKVNDADIYSRWNALMKSEFVQVRLGDQRILVLSTWAAMKTLGVDKNNSLLDRQHQPGFVDKLGIDISRSPLTNVIKKCRNAALVSLNHLNRGCEECSANQ